MPDDAPDQEVEGGRPEAELRIAKKRIKELEEQAAKVAELERREAFREAGIDPSDPKAKYFVKGYDGDLSVEAIRAQAIEAGFISPPEPPKPDPTVQTLGRVAEAAGGNASGDTRNDEFQAAMAGTKNYDDVLAVMRKFGVHVTGDDL